MTHFLVKALREDIIDIADTDNYVRIEGVYKWIVENIKEYNKDRNLPLPSLLGDQKLNFEIAKVNHTRQQKQKQEAYVEKLWKEHDSLIHEVRYIEGKLLSIQKNDEKEIEYKVKIAQYSKKINAIKQEIFLWGKKFQEDAKAKSYANDLYENIELKLRDYTELPNADNKFVGRKELIKKVFDLILRKKNVAVTGIRGMGGIGKTAVTVEICNYIKDSWDENPIYPKYLKDILGTEKHFEQGILWIRFEKKEPLKLLVQDKIAAQLGLKYSSDSDTKLILNELYRILKHKKYKNKILIILDSAEQNQSNFETIFRTFSDLPILVTSREKLDIESIDINLLDVEDAVQLFKNHYMDSEDKTHEILEESLELIETLCNEVGYLPLAIKLLAKRGKRYSKNIDIILSEFREKRLEVLNAKILTEKERKNENAIICFKMSYDDESLNEITKEVFMRCGLFYLPFKKDKINIAYENNDISKELDELCRISLIEYDRENDKYYLHPLMREFAIKNATDIGKIDSLYEWHKNNFLNENLMSISDHNDFQTVVTEMFKTIDFFSKQNNEQSYKTIIEIVNKHSRSLFKKIVWEACIELLDYGIRASEKLNLNDSLGNYYLEKADILNRQQNDKKAICFYNKSLKTNQKNAFFIYYSMFLIDYRNDKYQDTVYKNYLNFRDAYLENSNHSLSMLKSIGWVYRDFHVSTSEKLLISNLRKEEGKSSNLIKALGDLINLKYSKGFYNECIDYYKKLLNYAEKNQDGEMIVSLNFSLVENYLDIRNIKQAKKYLLKCENLISEMGLLHGFKEISYYKGRIEFSQQNYKNALSYFEHTEKDYIKHYWLGKTYLNINGEIAQAENYLLLALDFYKKQKDAVSIAKVYTQISLLEYKKEDGNLLKAVKYLTLAINTKKHYGIINLREEEEVKNIISQKDIATYNFLAKSFEEEYVDILSDFLINDLNQEVSQKNTDKKMILIPEGICFVTENASDECEIYNVDFILEHMDTFWEGFNYDTKATQLYLYPFYIDKYPVTNREYQLFCTTTNKPIPTHWEEYKDLNFYDKPITNITYQDALEYATWIGKKLPTRAEWEKTFTEKNIPFIDINVSSMENDKLNILHNIISGHAFDSNNKNEILKFLLGESIYQYLIDNPKVLKEWNDIDKSHIYALGDINEYNPNFVENLLLTDVEESIIKRFNWKRLMNLIAYSNGTSGVKRKIKLLKKISLLKEYQINKLYEIYVNEVVQLYKSQLQYTYTKIDYIKERNSWIIAVKSFLGLQSIVDSVERYDSEFIADKMIIEIYEKNEQQSIKNTIIDLNYKSQNVGFRCVKPIFSKKDYINFLNQ